MAFCEKRAVQFISLGKRGRRRNRDSESQIWVTGWGGDAGFFPEMDQRLILVAIICTGENGPSLERTSEARRHSCPEDLQGVRQGNLPPKRIKGLSGGLFTKAVNNLILWFDHETPSSAKRWTGKRKSPKRVSGERAGGSVIRLFLGRDR